MKKLSILTPDANTNDRGWGDFETIENVRKILLSAKIDCDVLVFGSNQNLLTELRNRSEETVYFPNSHYIGTHNSFFLVDILSLFQANYVGLPAPIFRAGSDKVALKQFCALFGIATPNFRLLPPGQHTTTFPRSVLKPRFGAASKGVFCKNLGSDISLAGEHIEEEYIREREFTIGIIGSGDDIQFSITEIVGIEHNDILTFEGKLCDMSSTIAPVTDKSTWNRLQSFATTFVASTGVSDFCRVDLVENTNGDLHLIDMNAMPGLTIDPMDIGMLPVCFRTTHGYSHAETVELIIRDSDAWRRNAQS